MSSSYVPEDPDEGRYLLPKILEYVADQVPERMHRVWADEHAGSGHPYRAVGGYNATFALEWGRSAEPQREDEEGPPPEQETEWSREYPDHGLTHQLLDIQFHDGVIYRIDIASVDGGRCWIPYPERADDGGWQVTNWEVAVVGLANALVHGTTDTLDYVKRAGIQTIERDPLVEM